MPTVARRGGQSDTGFPGGNMPHGQRCPCPAALLRSAARDDVAIALRDLAAGEHVTLDDAAIELLDAIPRSHKFALRSVSAGEPVRKYGQADRPGNDATLRAARTSTRTTWRRCSPA